MDTLYTPLCVLQSLPWHLNTKLFSNLFYTYYLLTYSVRFLGICWSLLGYVSCYSNVETSHQFVYSCLYSKNTCRSIIPWYGAINEGMHYSIIACHTLTICFLEWSARAPRPWSQCVLTSIPRGIYCPPPLTIAANACLLTSRRFCTSRTLRELPLLWSSTRIIFNCYYNFVTPFA